MQTPAAEAHWVKRNVSFTSCSTLEQGREWHEMIEKTDRGPFRTRHVNHGQGPQEFEQVSIN